MKSIADYSAYIDAGDLNMNQLLSVEKIIKDRVQSISKHLLTTVKDYETLLLLDYMMEMCLTRSKIMNNINVDFSLIHDKKAEKDYQN